jgi:hypothetical protein
MPAVRGYKPIGMYYSLEPMQSDPLAVALPAHLLPSSAEQCLVSNAFPEEVEGHVRLTNYSRLARRFRCKIRDFTGCLTGTRRRLPPLFSLADLEV